MFVQVFRLVILPSEHTSDPRMFRQQSDTVCKCPLFRQVSMRLQFEAITGQLLFYVAADAHRWMKEADENAIFCTN